MAKHLLLSIALFVVLGLIQVLICNNINLLNVATPFIFIYPLIRLPLTLHKKLDNDHSVCHGTDDRRVFKHPRNERACMRRPRRAARSYDKTLHHARRRNNRPRSFVQKLRHCPYMKYLFSMTLCFCIAITFIEAFTLRNFLVSLYRVIGCTLITFIILVGIDAIANAKNEKRL